MQNENHVRFGAVIYDKLTQKNTAHVLNFTNCACKIQSLSPSQNHHRCSTILCIVFALGDGVGLVDGYSGESPPHLKLSKHPQAPVVQGKPFAIFVTHRDFGNVIYYIRIIHTLFQSSIYSAEAASKMILDSGLREKYLTWS